MNRVQIAKLKDECLIAQARCECDLEQFGSDRDSVKLVNQDTVLELIERIEEVEGRSIMALFDDVGMDVKTRSEILVMNKRRVAFEGQVSRKDVDRLFDTIFALYHSVSFCIRGLPADCGAASRETAEHPHDHSRCEGRRTAEDLLK
jgi:hypothetical protein